MPIINLKSIYNVSSEDPLFPARNLLSTEVKKWKCRTAGESSAFVTMHLEKSTIIHGIDIGNEHSAFIVVLVGKNGSSNDDFKEILLTSSFMTPMESRNSENINRVRCFANNSLIEHVAKEKWDLIKFVCTQPFNKHVKYGLSFIKIHTNNEKSSTANENNDNKMRINSKNPIDEPSKNSQTIGKFKLRTCSSDSSSDNDVTGGSSLFQRWKESMNGNLASTKTPLNSAAAIREASSSPSLVTKHRKYDNNNTKLIIPPVVTKVSSRTDNKNIKNDSNNHCNDIDMEMNKESTSSTLNRNRSSLFYDDNDVDDEKSNSKFEKKLAKDREEFEKNKKINHQEKQNSQQTPKKMNNKMDNSVKKFNTFIDDKPKNSTNSVGEPHSLSTKKRPLSPVANKVDEPNRKLIKTPTTNHMDSSIVEPPSSKPVQYKPFNRLLENIVFTISGIQNPDRAKIRQKGLEMGAKYKQDWDNNCTHLICAFKNTPKYNQVRGHGKIVKKDWILNCYTKRKRLQWRKFALDENDASGTCSDDEILDITLKPKDSEINVEKEKIQTLEKTSKSPPIIDDNYNQVAIDDHNDDGDDDVEIINKPIEKYIISSDDSESDDTEDEIEKINKNKKEIFDVTTEEDDKDLIDDDDDDDNTLNGRKLIKPLPNLFENLKFYLQTTKDNHMKKIKRLILIYKGIITDDLTEANYLILTNDDRSSLSIELKDFNTFKGETLKSQWIFDCNDAEKLLPINKYRI